MTLFFRMPYAESLFLCGTLAVLYGMARRWPLIVLALPAGFVTAVPPVGVAVTAAFVWHVLTVGPQSPSPPLRGRGVGVRGNALCAAVLTPLACWGLLAFIGYQWLAFDAPWGFIQTQEPRAPQCLPRTGGRSKSRGGFTPITLHVGGIRIMSGEAVRHKEFCSNSTSAFWPILVSSGR